MADTVKKRVLIDFEADTLNADTKMKQMIQHLDGMGYSATVSAAKLDTMTQKVSAQFSILAKTGAQVKSLFNEFSGAKDLAEALGLEKVKVSFKETSEASKEAAERIKRYERETAEIRKQLVGEFMAHYKQTVKDRIAEEKEAQKRIAQQEKESADARKNIIKGFFDFYSAQEKARQKLIEAGRTADAKQAQYSNSLLHRNETGNFKSAQDSASVFQAQFDREVLRFKEASARRLELLRSTLDRELVIAKHGAESRERIEYDLSQREIGIRRKLQIELLRIERALAEGTISLVEATARRRAAVAKSADQTINFRQQARKDLEGLSPETDRWYDNLLGKVFSFSAAYRAINYSINLIRDSVLSIPRIGIELESTRASLISTAGSLAKATGIISALNAEARRTGISLASLRQSFRTFQASTSLAGESLETTWRMFTNINTVAAALHLNTEQTNNVFLALAQIFNKNKVQAEELVKQLGNLLPGAFASFQKANQHLFKDTEALVKAMQQGVVTAHETVANFTDFMANRFGAAFNAASHGLNAELGRLQTSFTLLGEAIYNNTSGIMADTVRGLTSLADTLTGAVKGTNDLGFYAKSLGQILTVVAVGALLNAANVAKLFSTNLVTLASSALLAANNSKILASSLSFLSSPGFMIAGIGFLATELYKVSTAVQQVSEDIDEFYARLTAKQSKPKVLTLEMKVEEDQTVIEAKKLLERAEKEKVNVFSTLFPSGKDAVAAQEAINKAEKALILARQVARENLESSDKLTNPETITILQKAVEDSMVQLLEAQGKHAEAQQRRFVTENSETFALLGRSATNLYSQALEAAKKGDFVLRDILLKGSQEASQALSNYQERYLSFITLAEQKAAKVTKQWQLMREEAAITIDTLKVQEQKDLAALKLARQTEINKASAQGLELAKSRELYWQQQIAKVTMDAANKELQVRQETLNTVNKQYAITEENNRKALEVIRKIEGANNNPGTVSPAGAVGIGQVMPSTAFGMGIKDPNKDAVLLAESIARHNYKEGITKLNPHIEKTLRDFALRHSDELSKIHERLFLGLVNKYQDYVKASAAYNAGEAGAGLIRNKGQLLETELPRETQGYINRFRREFFNKDELDATKDVQKEILDSAKAITEQQQQQLELEGELNRLKYETSLQTQQAQIELLKSFETTKEIGTQREIELDFVLRIKQAQSEGNFALAETLKALQKVRVEQALYSLEVEKIDRLLQNSRDNFQRQQEFLRASVDVGSGDSFVAAQQMLELQEKQWKFEEAQLTTKLALAKQNQDIIAQMQIMNDLAAIQNQKQLEQKTADKLSKSVGYFGESELASQEAQYAAELALLQKYHKDTELFEFMHWQTMQSIWAQSVADKYTTLGSYFSDITGLMQQFYGEQSSQARAAFAFDKASRAASAGMQTYDNATKAYGIGLQIGGPAGMVLGAAFAAIATAAGIANVAKILSQPMPSGGAAHGGLTNVPKEQTYLLDRGERVVSPNQNRDLTDYLRKQKKDKPDLSPQVVVNPTPPQNIQVINVVDPELMYDYMGDSKGSKIIMNTVRKETGAY